MPLPGQESGDEHHNGDAPGGCGNLLVSKNSVHPAVTLGHARSHSATLSNTQQCRILL